MASNNRRLALSAASLAERLYTSRGADLLRYVRRRLKGAEDAGDIAQEAYLRFIRLKDPERLLNPEAYMFRIAANLLWERRLRENAGQAGAPLEEMPVEEQTPYDHVVAAEQVALLQALLAGLPQLNRAVLMLHLRDEMTFAEIATHAGITTSLAKKIYYKTLLDCREQLMTAQAGQGLP